jgi:hypothetical protein
MAEKTVKKPARKPRPRPTHALDFTVWSVDGAPLAPPVVAKFEAAIQAVQVELFNDGIRLLTQTTKA